MSEASRVGVRRAVKVMAVGVAACCLLVGTADAAGRSPGTPAGTIALVGDSNLILGSAALQFALADRDDGYLVVNAARSGSTIRADGGGFWQARLRGLKRAVDVNAYVVNLGINDTRTPGTPTGPGYADYRRKVDWLLGQFGSKTPVLWSNLPCAIEPAERAPGCAAINRALAAATRRHANLTVVDWAKAANTHAAWIKGLHHTYAGQTEYAKLIARTVARQL
jgi:hypothetical protein